MSSNKRINLRAQISCALPGLLLGRGLAGPLAIMR